MFRLIRRSRNDLSMNLLPEIVDHIESTMKDVYYDSEYGSQHLRDILSREARWSKQSAGDSCLKEILLVVLYLYYCVLL